MKKYNKILITLFIILVVCVSICFVPMNASKLIPVIESQVQKEFGLKVHIEKLVLRTGPFIKIKAPIMHVMYDDGNKFAQFDNVKFYIPWSIVFKDNVEIAKIVANKLQVRIKSDDTQFFDLLKYQ